MRKNKIAFTLVEILLALAILGVGLVAILSLFVVGINSVRSSIEITQAALAGQMTMEKIKQEGYSGLSGYGSGWQDMGDLKDSSGITVYEDFTRKISVTNPIEYIPYLRQAELIIESKKNNKELARFVTYITKYEPL